MMCGAPHPDMRNFNGRPVTCHLVKDHGGLWHRWDHEFHVKPGQEFGHGMIAWHTEFGKKLSAGIRPMLVQLEQPYRASNGRLITHDVVPHPTTVMMRNNLPDKPTP